MNAKKIITLLLAAVLVLSLAACGTKPAENGGGDGEPQTLEEAKTLYDQLVAMIDLFDINIKEFDLFLYEF